MATKKQKKISSVKTVKAKTLPPLSPNPLFEKYALVISTGLSALIAFFIFRDYLLLTNVYLFKDIGSDTLNASYPTICMYADYLKQHGFPSWSFSYGIGQNILPFFLRDPFDIFLYYAGRDSIPYMIGWMEFAKVLLTAFFFFSYLRLVVKDGFAQVVGTLLFSFCGFIILGSGWYIFTSEAFILSLLLLAFEKLFQQRQWWLFPLPIALIGISQPFNLFVYGLFLFTYVLVRFYESEPNPLFSKLFPLFGKMIACSIIGLLMSAVFLIPNIIQLMESPRGSGISAYTNQLKSTAVFKLIDALQFKTVISRFFSNDLMGTGVNFKGWNNYLEAPLLYCGILTLFLIPLGFVAFNKKRRIIYLLFLGCWTLPLIFPYFRYSFWLFTGDYYRAFSFCVTMAFIYVAARSLEIFNSESRKINYIVLATTVFILFVAASSTTIPEIKNELLFFLTILMIVLYPVFMILLVRRENKYPAQYALLFFILVEMSYMGYITTSNRRAVNAGELKQKIGYNDYSSDAVAFIKSIDRSFFRIDKNYSSSPAMHASINDGMVQGYYGTSEYNSFSQLNYVRALDAMGVINAKDEAASRWVPGVRGRLLLEDLFSVKYLLWQGPIPIEWNFKQDSVNHIGDITVIKNIFSMPLGFAYDQYILQSDFKKVSKNYSDAVFLSAVLIPDSIEKTFSGFRKMTSFDTASFNPETYRTAINVLKKDTMTLTALSQTRVEGKIAIPKKEIFLISIPYDKGWSARVNGKPQEIVLVDGGLIGLLLDKGVDNIELTYANRYFTASFILSGIGCLLFLILVFIERMFMSKREGSVEIKKLQAH